MGFSSALSRPSLHGEDGVALELGERERGDHLLDDRVEEGLRLAERLATELRRRRFGRGALRIETREITFAFDGHGNYTFGVTEQLIFPEIDYDKIDTTRGMDITIVTSARTDDEGRALMRALGFPFRRTESVG